MGYLFAFLGSVAALCAAFATLAAFANGTDIQLILAAVLWMSAMLGWIGAGIIFRMDDYHSSKETKK